MIFQTLNSVGKMKIYMNLKFWLNFLTLSSKLKDPFGPTNMQMTIHFIFCTDEGTSFFFSSRMNCKLCFYLHCYRRTFSIICIFTFFSLCTAICNVRFGILLFRILRMRDSIITKFNNSHKTMKTWKLYVTVSLFSNKLYYVKKES